MLPVLVPAVFVVSRQALRTHSSAYALVLTVVVTGIALTVLAGVAMYRRRCPACGKVRSRSIQPGRGEVLACRSCGYEEARGWAYRAGGSVH